MSVLSSSGKRGSVLVVGGGIGGMQAALDLADSGFKVHLVQRESSIGGTMSSLDKTFPTGDCAMCMISPKMVGAGRHMNIEILTQSEVTALGGAAGDFTASVLKKSRFIDPKKCTGCMACVEKCPVFVPSEYDQGLVKRTAINRRYAQAVPGIVTVDKLGISPCRVDCPAEVNAHAYVTLTAAGRYQEALDVVRRTNPFPASIGRVCTHPCESACRRGDVDAPVQICYLKRFLTDWEDAHGGFKAPALPAEKLEKVAVIGSGPAGMTCARDLALKGYQVTVFEKLPVAGGMLRVSIPAYRLPKDVVQKEVDQIRSLGVEVRLNQALGKDFTIDSLQKDGFKAVFVALGTHKALQLQIPGEKEFPQVLDCIAFLRDVNLDQKPDYTGKKVVVVGGGNAAIDSARTSLRLGADVVIAYRRTVPEMPANSWEIEEAEEEGVKIQTLVAPVKVVGAGGKVTGLEVQKMQLGEPDKSGRRRPVPIEGSNYVLPCDVLIAAISQEPDLAGLEGENLKVNKWQCFEADPATLATSRPGVFAGGDVVSGPSTVVQAIGMGRDGAESIHRYLRGLDLHENRPKLKDRTKFIKDIAGIRTSPKAGMPKLPLPERRGNFKETELGFPEPVARQEASRCLNCGGCCECYLCVDACLAKAIVHDSPYEEQVELQVGAVILAPGAQLYDAKVRGELGLGRWPNVVTSIQFERILSASGPSKGVVQRPSDAKHPVKVAWIQCVGSRDPHNANPWCSSVCCMYATKQAIIAKEHDAHIEPKIFFMEMRAFGKDFDKYVERAKNEYGVKYQRAMVSAIREEPGTGNLVLRHALEDGKLVDETFDLVVLSVGFEPHQDAARFAEIFGIEANDYRFAKTSGFAPVETTRPGVFVTGTYQGPKDIPDTVTQGSAVAGGAMALLAEARGTEVVKKELPPETDVAGQEPRIGVFVCHCGTNISSTVKIDDVVASLKGQPGVAFVTNTIYACAQDSQESMKQIIKEQKLNRIVVASCTPRTHEPLFQETIREAGLNKYLFDLADIREQCSWCHKGQNAAATKKAIGIVKMAVAKSRLQEPLHQETVGVTPGCLIIGGGVAGMTAALSLADQGFTVALVEKDPQLGGLAGGLRYTLEGGDVPAFLKGRIAAVTAHPRISVHTGAEVATTEGFVGNFVTTLTTGAKVEHGAIVLATGGVEYQPTEYLYGTHERVITQRALEQRLAAGAPAPAGGRYVMIQCVGSREEPNQYCSRVCCQDAIKNAIKIKQTDPTAQVIVVYRDIRTYGLREDYYRQARELGVLFVRYDVERKPVVEPAGGGLTVRAFDPMLDRDIEIAADWVVLSTGLRPHPTTDATGARYKVTRNPDGYYLEAHVKLRPVDFPSEGLFVCGLGHAPKNLDETIGQAQAAAGRAGVLLSHERLAVSGIIAKHKRALCMSCLSCLRVCPFGSPYIDKDGMISHNEVKCMGCGICAGICPAKAFQVNNFRDDQIFAMIDAAAETEPGLVEV
jgi:heterodisulfide reductase subunit A-like polyferredoxin